jgi:hypothetical protein
MMVLTGSLAAVAAVVLLLKVLRRHREYAGWLGRVKDCRPLRW